MYRLVLYYLIVLFVIACGFSLSGILPFSFFSLLFTVAFLIMVSWFTNTIFAKVFHAPTNLESIYISALILTLIVAPVNIFSDLGFLSWAAVWTAASKFIFAFNKKHLFNPVVFAVALCALTINQSATWWIGTSSMIPFVLIGGLLIVRKVRKEDMFLSFIMVGMGTILGYSFIKNADLISSVERIILDSPLIFLGAVMLTEPLTTPPTKKLQIIYGALVGFLFTPQIHIGSFYSTPELALIFGNIFSFLVSPKYKLILKLQEKRKIAFDIWDFVFTAQKELLLTPGQYMEWTLFQKNPDSRGSRRYFTLASSPTENEIRLGIKFPIEVSSFKKSLFSLPIGGEIMAGQLAGEFTLPSDQSKKMVFIAGGVGITPFRSMLKYLLDNRQKREITVFYSNRNASEIAYRDVLDQADQQLGIKIIYTLTDVDQVPQGWIGKIGWIDEKMIKEEVPDFNERFFYLSGPHGMVKAFEETLSKIGVKKSQIKTDYFPGFA